MLVFSVYIPLLISRVRPVHSFFEKKSILVNLLLIRSRLFFLRYLVISFSSVRTSCTTTSQLAINEPSGVDAVILVLPLILPVTRPFSSTLAMFSSSDFQTSEEKNFPFLLFQEALPHQVAELLRHWYKAWTAQYWSFRQMAHHSFNSRAVELTKRE